RRSADATSRRGDSGDESRSSEDDEADPDRVASPRGRAVSVPAVVITLPVEGTATAHLRCASLEDECRIALDLEQRDVLLEVISALVRLYDALADSYGDGEGAP